MKKLFISFAASDWEGRELANYLRHTLGPLGFEILSSGVESSWALDIEASTTALINKCDVFLCYTDNKNPNVMFELGYAVGANKKVILIGDAKTIPSDLRNTLYIRRGAAAFEILDYLERNTELSARSPFELRVITQDPIEAISALVERPDWLGSVEPPEFEELIASWFSAKGFQVERNWDGRDSGYDFTIFPFRGERALVEVKKYKQTSQVPVSTIRQMVGSMAIENAQYGVVVSSAPFTQAAKYFSTEIGQKLLLLTLADLDRMKVAGRNAIEHSVKG